MISDRATICPHCGHPVMDLLNDASADEVSQPTVYYEEEPKKASKTLIIIDVILFVIAIGLGGYLLGTGKFNTDKPVAAADTVVAVDTTDSQKEVATEDEPEDIALADTTHSYVDNIQSTDEPLEEPGFKTASDIENYVIGKEWVHGDVTLSITSECVFANNNKISTSRPRFIRRSNDLGEITALPNISITVKYGENILVDNQSGDSYEEHASY